MAGESFRTEQTESGRAYSRVLSNSQFSNLWNLQDIRALNQREQTQIAQAPAEFQSPSGAAGIIARDAGSSASPVVQIRAQSDDENTHSLTRSLGKTMGAELHDNAEARRITPNGAESPRLSVSSGEMADLQAGERGGGLTVTEREQALFGNGGFDFATVGDIYGGQKRDLLADKPDASEKIRIADKPHGKLIPKDGQDYTLKQLLTEYKTPFIDAYEHSKQLQDSEPGKSKTLEDIIDRMKACPWADQIHVKFDSSIKHPEYDELNSTIQIDPRRTTSKQIEDFAHESYHASHQFLSKQYGGAMLDKQTYINTFMWGEVGSMVAEARVHDELKLSGQRTRFNYVTSQGTRDHIVINDYVQEHGLKGLFDFLGKTRPAGEGEKVYSEYYSGFYDSYRKNYVNVKPAAEALIRKWQAAGHDAKDI